MWSEYNVTVDDNVDDNLLCYCHKFISNCNYMQIVKVFHLKPNIDLLLQELSMNYQSVKD